MIKYIIIILIYTSVIFSQEKQNSVLLLDSTNTSESNVNVYFGIRDEIIIMFGNLENKNVVKTDFPINIHVLCGLKFLKYFKIEVRLGLIYVFDDFSGYDGGIYMLTHLFKTNIFTEVGIERFHNIGSSHGGSFSGGNITLLCFGIGYNTSKNFNLDISYCIPDKRKIGIDEVIGFRQTYDKVVNGLLRVGFQYSFIF